MSTDRQQYSIENQKTAIHHYAQRHGFEIVRTYADAGRTGVILKLRSGLTQLLTDVLGGEAEYKAILVYDVSRWGRFQDADESAHYEFLCKSAGIPVHYCGEQFSNDDTLPSSIFKALKRAMAAEYSRELGVKVFAAQKRFVQLGFRMGGHPSYGLRRLLLPSDGGRTRQLKAGQQKGFARDRIILTPGPRNEVRCVRAIYAMILRNMTMSDIARKLNQQGIPYIDGRQWTCAIISRTLRNPSYAGRNIWHRMTCRLHTASLHVPPEQWIIKLDAFEPVISPALFDQVQVVLRKRRERISNDELLSSLKRILRSNGKLTRKILMNAPNHPPLSMCLWRFGNFRCIYKMIGYEPSPKVFARVDARLQRQQLRVKLLAQITALFPQNIKASRPSLRRRFVLRLDNGLCIAVEMCGSYLTKRGKLRWKLYPNRFEKDYVTLLCLLNRENTEISEFYMFNRLGRSRGGVIKEADAWLATAKRIEVPQIYETAKGFQSSSLTNTSLATMNMSDGALVEPNHRHTKQPCGSFGAGQTLRSLTRVVDVRKRRKQTNA